jgi:membrane protein
MHFDSRRRWRFYTLFSIAPLLVVAVGIASFAFGSDAVRGQLFDELRGMMGDQSAEAVQSAVAAAAVTKSPGIAANAVSVVTLLIGASAVFAEPQDALNMIWDAKPQPAGWRSVARKRILSLAMYW